MQQTSATESVNDLRLQLRELTDANLDLRAQLKEQSGTIEKLKAEFRETSRRETTGNLEAFISDLSPLVNRLHPNSFYSLGVDSECSTAAPIGSGTVIAMTFRLPTEFSCSLLCACPKIIFESPCKLNNSVIPLSSHLNRLGLSFKAATATDSFPTGKMEVLK